MNSILEAIKNVDIPTTPGEILTFLNTISFPVAVFAIGFIVLFAIQGYKIFKSFLFVASCMAFAFIGKTYLGPIVEKFAGPHIPATISIDLSIVTAFLCALIAFLITKYAYKLMIFLLGGGVGFLAGYYFVAGFLARKLPTLGFLSHWVANIVIGAVLALMCALFFVIAFKHIYIIGLSVGGMGVVGYILYNLVMGTHNRIVMFSFIGVAMVLGMFAAHHQYVEDDKETQFYF